MKLLAKPSNLCSHSLHQILVRSTEIWSYIGIEYEMLSLFLWYRGYKSVSVRYTIVGVLQVTICRSSVRTYMHFIKLMPFHEILHWVITNRLVKNCHSLLMNHILMAAQMPTVIGAGPLKSVMTQWFAFIVNPDSRSRLNILLFLRERISRRSFPLAALCTLVP